MLVRTVILLLGLALSVTGWVEAQSPLQVDPTLDHVPGEILIKLRHHAGETGAVQCCKHLGAREVKRLRRSGVRRWKLPRGLTTRQALRRLERGPFQGIVEYAEPNYIVHATNDTRRADLWGMHNLGQSGGTVDADIDALEAWQLQQGSSATVVGIIDSGIDYNHEDLKDNIWVNTAELNGQPGVDDDNNGYIDDVRGWDFVSDDNDPMDDYGHGTHTAGTVGAVGNNGLGVVGVAPNVKLMALKSLNSGGSGTTAAAIEAIEYAARFGVPITNNSWSGGRKSKALENAIRDAGALFVAAAGNDGSTRAKYPAGYSLDNIVSVAATDHDDGLASFSNRGSSWVDLGAPGTSILSTMPGDSYGHMDGTSMACPHVAGVAALVMARFPALDVAGVKSRILSTVDPVPALSGQTLTGGRVNARVAVGAPELPADAIAPAAVNSLLVDPGSITFNSVAINWTATGDDGLTGTAYLYDVRYLANAPVTEANWNSAARATGEPAPAIAGNFEVFTVTGLLADTTYYIALKVMDERGNLSGLSNVAVATTAAPPPSAWEFLIAEAGSGKGSYIGHSHHPTTGLPSICYSDGEQVKYAAYDGASWNIEVIEAGGPGVSHAHAPNGNPAVSHGWGKLQFARRIGNAWIPEIVVSKKAYNDETSLVYDANGNPSIAFWTSYAKGGVILKFARWTGSAWDIQTVDPGGSGRWKQLAYDPSGKPSIAYCSDIDDDGWIDTLKFARWDGSKWNVEVVESGPVGYGVSADLAYDPAGNPTIVHQGAGTVRFCRWNGSGWAIEDVAPGSWCRIMYDANGTALISIFDQAQGMVLATRNGTGWDTELVAAEGGGSHHTLEPDASGNPTLSWGGIANSQFGVFYVRRTGQ